jgi:hypothetical protein
LQFEGYAAHGAALDPLHEVRGVAGDLEGAHKRVSGGSLGWR